MREREELQTANTIEDRKRSSSSDSRSVIVTSLYNGHSHLHQLSVMRIAEGREEQPHWVVRREEVELTEEVVGRGGWGEVRVARFRGLRVAAKFLYDVILSDNHLTYIRIHVHACGTSK